MTGTTQALLHSVVSSLLEDWEDKDLYAYVSLYGIQIVIGALLSAVTIYRREMSCNRVFHDQEEEEDDDDDDNNNNIPGSNNNNNHNNHINRRNNNNNNNNNNSDDDDDADDDDSISKKIRDDALEKEAEELLDGAGMYCSGQPILAFAALWLEYFVAASAAVATETQNNNNNNDMEVKHKNHNSKLTTIRKDDDELLFPLDVLDHAGNYSTEPIMAAVALVLLRQRQRQQQQQKEKNQTTTTMKNTIEPPKSKTNNGKQQQLGYDPFSILLPPDVHVHISSFLHPKDLTMLTCVSKSYQDILERRDDSSKAIWKTLWERDYAWIVQRWSVGQQAMERSFNQSLPSSSSPSSFVVDKEFYFSFSNCYMNYVLAGQNTQESCLVGLHSHIYDITNFLHAHPGSPDTLMVHAGKDCTAFFEDMGHSLIARRLAKKLCVVADLSRCYGYYHNDNNNENNNDYYDGWGARPTPHTVVNNGSSHLPRREPNAGENLLLGRKQRRPSSRSGGKGGGGGTLQKFCDRFKREEEQVRYRVLKGDVCCPDALASVTPFYDPFRKEWHVWYTSRNLETVFRPA